MKRIFLVVVMLSLWHAGFAQNDTTPPVVKDTPAKLSLPKRTPTGRTSASIKKDTVVRVASDSSIKKDSIVTVDSTVVDTLAKKQTLPVLKFTGMDCTYIRFLRNPFLQDGAKPVYQIMKLRQQHSKDDLFYLIAGLVFMLAFIKLFFSKYFANIFRLFLQPSFRQKQTREQLMQSSLPSFLLNLFFLFSAGIYIALLLQHFAILDLSFWLMFLYCTLGLLMLYLLKYVFLSFSGWVFNVREASATYIFVVNLINKILGVVLLPFIFAIAFSTRQVVEVSVTISIMLFTLLFLYRFVISYGPVRREVSVSALHFAMYILSFEVLPLLLIYKSIMFFLIRTH